MRSYNDTHQRSVFKALSWRMVATTATISIVFAFTGKLGLSTGVGVVEVMVKICLYYLHERLWGSIAFGRQET